ncbi:hypothetical protein PIB30_049244 [Stylosanthes scabra]|uniref:Uncharacterized protein n=1 Tax=Stylosanthes scabra TaxID=79078 RepID=A0ABU6SHR0_9FABA|nr:hypothetical protein [Stylosanthes scabra]
MNHDQKQKHEGMDHHYHHPRLSFSSTAQTPSFSPLTHPNATITNKLSPSLPPSPTTSRLPFWLLAYQSTRRSLPTTPIPQSPPLPHTISSPFVTEFPIFISLTGFPI